MADSNPSSDIYQRAKLLLFDAVEQPPAERARFLDGVCGGDRALRLEVESLLDHADERGDAFSDSAIHRGRLLLRGALVPADGGEADADAALAEELPTAVGRYEVVRLLGRGGMGQVLEARQQSPQRRVAVKLIRPGAVSPETLRRFRHEVEALGQLHHPGIAQIFEAGTAQVDRPTSGSSTQPFFAMELVRGERLIDFARARRLSIRDRLELVARICDAVQHAHQRGVIHRDLKPANILVTESGQPKILDFGVARATDADVSAATVHTTAGELLGTLPYMSPEQLAGDSRNIDTRCDVYGVGVVAFELLAGRAPFDTGGKSIAEAIRILSDTEPMRPGAIRPALRGDVELILGKTMQREPDRRYASAAELGADIRRFLGHEPITARPPATLYQLARFARRHRVLVGAAAAVLVIFVGATAWTTWSMVSARRATDRATAINKFMEDILSSADPEVRPADVRLVEVLREAADEAATRFAQLPEVEADVRLLLGHSFRSLALHPEAAAAISRAYDLRRETLGPDHLDSLRTATELASLLQRVQRTGEAIDLADDVLERMPPQLRDQPTALSARLIRANVIRVRGDIDGAVDELRAILRVARASLGEDHATTLAAASRLAQCLWTRVVRNAGTDPETDIEEALAISRDVYQRRLRVSGPEHPSTHHAAIGLAQVLLESYGYEEAARLAQCVLDSAPSRFGADHELATRALCTLRLAAFHEGRFEEAADFLIREIDAERRRAGGADSIESLSPMSDGLPVLDAGGRVEVGEEYARVLYERFKEMSTHDPSLPIRYRAILARFISRQGRLDEADHHFAEILPLEPHITSPSLQERIDLAYGGHLVARGEFEAAEARLLGAHQRMGPGNVVVVAVRQELARLYEAWEKPDLAAQWHKRSFAPIK
jgi:tetratricopeptide (TPR) repeat protein